MPTSDWIKFRKKLLRDGRVLALSRVCRADRATVIGALVALWCLGDDYAEDDGRLPGYTPADIDAEVGIPGFVEALPSDWCRIDGEAVFLPDYFAHNGTTAKKRAENTARQKLSRDSRDKSATRGEESREEKNKEPASAGSPHSPPRAKRKQTAKAEEIPIPGPLNTAEFHKAWSDWLAYRRELKKPVTPTGANAQLSQFCDWGIPRAIAAIRNTIQRGWQGLREPDGDDTRAAGDPRGNIRTVERYLEGLNDECK